MVGTRRREDLLSGDGGVEVGVVVLGFQGVGGEGNEGGVVF